MQISLSLLLLVIICIVSIEGVKVEKVTPPSLYGNQFRTPKWRRQQVSTLKAVVSSLRVSRLATAPAPTKENIDCVLDALISYQILWSYQSDAPSDLTRGFYKRVGNCIPGVEIADPIGLPTAVPPPPAPGPSSVTSISKDSSTYSQADPTVVIPCIRDVLLDVPTEIRDFLLAVIGCIPGLTPVYAFGSPIETIPSRSQTTSLPSSTTISLSPGTAIPPPPGTAISLSSGTAIPLSPGTAIARNSTSTASATGSVSMSSGNPQCSDPAFKDPSEPNYVDKCTAAGCNATRQKGVQQWKDYVAQGSPGGGNFALRMAYSWGGPQNFFCSVEENNCEAPAKCTDVAGPGGYLVQTEMSGFTKYHRQLYDYLSSELLATLTGIDKFSQTIALVKPDDDLWLKIMVAVAGLFGGQALGAIIRKITFKAKPAGAAGNPEYITQEKLFLSNAVLSGSAIGVNLIQPPTQQGVTADLSKYLGEFYNSTRILIKAYVQDTFSGEGAGLDHFNELFGSGIWANNTILPQLASLNIGPDIQTLYYGMLTSPAWYATQRVPIVFYLDTDCEKRNDVIPGMKESDVEKVKLCHDGKTLYLIDYSNGFWDIMNKGYSQDTSYTWKFKTDLKVLQGFDSLDGKTWATLRWQSLAISSWDGYKQNGFKQPYESKPLFTNGTGTNDPLSPFGNGIETPGLINMTICPVSSLKRPDVLEAPPPGNWKKSPCPEIPASYEWPIPGNSANSRVSVANVAAPTPTQEVFCFGSVCGKKGKRSLYGGTMVEEEDRLWERRETREELSERGRGIG